MTEVYVQRRKQPTSNSVNLKLYLNALQKQMTSLHQKQSQDVR